MPFNGSGTFQRVRNWVNDATAGIKIRADRHDSEDDNFASGLSQCITKDGQTTITGNLPMATYRHTGVGAAVNATDYARYDQVQLGKSVWAVAGGTADAITATYSPSTTAPVDGQLYFVRAGAANTTTTPTFAPDGQTARTITKYGNQALGAGDIFGAGHEMILRYRSSDTKYELLNPSISNLYGDVSGGDTHKLVNMADGTDPQDYVTKAQLDALQTVPTGTSINFAGTSAPSGYLVEDGSAVSRTTYAALFSAIGTTHGSGDGSTTFNIPDRVTNNRFVRAAGGSLSVGNTQTHSFASHSHGTPGSGNFYTSDSSAAGSYNAAGGTYGQALTSNTGSAGGTETRPNNIAYLPCIKF